MGETFIGSLAGFVRRHVRTVPEAQLSVAIQLARIALITGLVFLHYGMYPNLRLSPFRGASIEEHEIATFVNSYLLFFFFSVVPLLSLISGWLFFSFFDEEQKNAGKSLARRVRRRVSSLFIPMVLWNALYLGILGLVFVNEPGHPLLSGLNIDFRTAGFREYANAMLAVNHYPVAYQFWFVRDLFVTVLLSPLLWLALTRAPWIGGGVLLLGWLANFDFGVFLRPDVAFFFYLGGLLREKRASLGIDGRTTVVLLIIYLLLVAVRTAMPWFIAEPAPLLSVATRAMRLVGVLACWGVFLRVAATPWGQRISGFGSIAFFLYAAHFPLMAEVKLLLWNLLPRIDDFWMIAHYLVSVALTVALCLLAARFLARAWPGAFLLLNGAREPGFKSPARPTAVSPSSNTQ
jgi:succinoglycan biosynthesis protein ExoH